MEKIKKLLIFLILGLKSFAYMQVAPIIFDKRIDKGGAIQEFYITNPTNQEVGYRIYKEKSDTGLDMTQYMEFYPKTLKLKSGESGKIRVYIEAPKDSTEGEYTTIMGIKEINIPSVKKSGNGNVIIYTDLKLELAGYVGDLKPNLEIKDLKLKNNELTFKISNIGEIRTKVEAYLESDNLKEAKYLDTFRLLKNKESNFNQKLKLKNLKNPRLVINDMDGNKILEKEIKE
ncbi:MAG: hypothetical protein ACRC4T_24705 [Cetobacterium sp.]